MNALKLWCFRLVSEEIFIVWRSNFIKDFRFNFTEICAHVNFGVYLSTRREYGLWSFQMGNTKLERFLPKNQHTQRKLLNFEFWINGELFKSAKVWLLKSIFYVKNHSNLSQFFFSLKNTNLGAHYLLLTCFDKINF